VKHLLLLLVAAALLAAVLMLNPIAQDEAYHRFADSRHLLGIPNFWNVVSNVLFAYAGIAGLRYLAAAGPPGIVESLLPSYRVFFSGLLLTAMGSAWYHAGPGIETMVWDRLPMTLAFMSLFSIVIGEQVSVQLGRRLLLPLLLAGAGTVIYWWLGESAGRGDLRPYVLVQFMPMALIPMMLAMYQSPFDRTGFIWLMIVLYAAAKVFEYIDYSVFALGGLISGHSIKHIVAALATLVFLHGLRNRVRRENSKAIPLP
jgi:hypothetical protein